jgi:hypothetical protein
MMRRALLLAALGSAALPATAAAQFVAVSFGTGGPPVSATRAHVRITGAVTVDFHGDAASGCAGEAICDADGTITWEPKGSGDLFAFGYRDHGVRFEQGSLVLGGGPLDQGDQTSTFVRVRRTSSGGGPSGLCADAGGEDFDDFAFGPERGTSLPIGVLGTGGSGAQPAAGLHSRCAGPTAADVSGLLPTRLISEAEIRGGPHKLGFVGDRDFSAGGLAGTLHSTLVIHIGRGSPFDLRPGQSRGRTVKRRRRTLEVRYHVDQVFGQVATDVIGLTDPDLCGPLDACGLMGSTTLAPRATSGDAIISAEASARHSWRDLRQAVGLSPGRPPKGVSSSGLVYWGRDAGTVTSDLTRDGAAACSDSQPLSGGGGVSLRIGARAVRARYGEGDQSAGGLFETRCPGPLLADVVGGGALASAAVPLRTFGPRQVTLRLRDGRSYSSDGYRGTTRPDITVVMHRTRIKQRNVVYEVPADFARIRARLAR